MRTLLRTFTVILLAAVSVFAQPSPQDSKSQVANDKEIKQPAIAVLKEPTVLGAGETWAVISWTTNQKGRGHSVIYAGTERNNMKPMEQTVADTSSDLVDSYQEQEYEHLVRLNNLKPGTTYYFRADSSKEGDHGVASRSGIWTFTTMTLEPGLMAAAKHTDKTSLRAISGLSSARRSSVNETSAQFTPRVAQPRGKKTPASGTSESARLQTSAAETLSNARPH